MTPNQLADRCQQVSTLTDQAIKWLQNEKNANAIGRERDALSKTMQRAGARARRLEKAALRPMCVGVFGPSQAGKSYLVEVLARPENGVLKARFEGHDPIDFLTHINPVGEKESTGLVTRFTVQSPTHRAPAEFPVRLRLLTEPDLIRILGNTFFLDGDQTKETEVDPEALAGVLADLRSHASPTSTSMSEDDFLDIQAYFQKQFGREPLVNALAQLWQDGLELLPRLDVEGRSKYFSFLWGRHKPFTELYRRLAQALSVLGGATEAFAPMKALIPREGSILDVATLSGIGNLDDNDQIELRTAAGASLKLSRSLVAALTAELVIQVAEVPRPLFESTDLLDFPGARSRQKVHLEAFFSEKNDALKETFLRGKVAYLFDRYVVEQELTSMLLCIRPSNQEVITLPNLINDWIENTHGKTPEARRDQPNLLFLILTWFDTHFIDKAGDADVDGGLRFRNRLEASLLGFFGKAHDWPQRWTPDDPFRNSYWFRNPNYPADAIIRYENKREVEFLPNKLSRIQELRNGFINLPDTSAHFQDPSRAFDEALKLNDGGIGYISENLSKVCKTDIKLRQIEARLNELCEELRRTLARFHVSLDLEKRLEERRSAADQVFSALELFVEQRRFGDLLRALMLDPIELTNVFYNPLHTLAQIPSTPITAPPRATRIVRPRAKAAKDAEADSSKSDRETRLARAAVDYWFEHSERALSDDVQLQRFGLTASVGKEITNELQALGRRTDLEQQIAADLRLLLAFDGPEQAGIKSALIAATHVNRLVGDLGFGRVANDHRPEVHDEASSRRAFATRPIVYDASGIGREPRRFAEQFATDWFHGFDRVVEDNARSEQGVTVDLAQNQHLKSILDGLAPTSAD